MSNNDDLNNEFTSDNNDNRNKNVFENNRVDIDRDVYKRQVQYMSFLKRCSHGTSSCLRIDLCMSQPVNTWFVCCPCTHSSRTDSNEFKHAWHFLVRDKNLNTQLCSLSLVNMFTVRTLLSFSSYINSCIWCHSLFFICNHF